MSTRSCSEPTVSLRNRRDVKRDADMTENKMWKTENADGNTKTRRITTLAKDAQLDPAVFQRFDPAVPPSTLTVMQKATDMNEILA